MSRFIVSNFSFLSILYRTDTISKNKLQNVFDKSEQMQWLSFRKRRQVPNLKYFYRKLVLTLVANSLVQLKLNEHVLKKTCNRVHRMI